MAESCANCGERIGSLEQPYVWREHVVCLACHEKLTTAPEVITPASNAIHYNNGYVSISDKELVVGGQSFPLRNIASVTTAHSELEASGAGALRVFWVTIAGIGFIVFAGVVQLTWTMGTAMLMLGSGCAMVGGVVMAARGSERRHVFHAFVTNNAGERQQIDFGTALQSSKFCIALREVISRHASPYVDARSIHLHDERRLR